MMYFVKDSILQAALETSYQMFKVQMTNSNCECIVKRLYIRRVTTHVQQKLAILSGRIMYMSNS